MTRRPPEKTSCIGKKRHDDRKAAVDHLLRLVRRGVAKFRLNAYRCRFCGAWHVGHRLAPKGKHR